MTNQEKGIVYDELIRENDVLQRKISRLKSEYPVNMPDNIQRDIDKMEREIKTLVIRLENLFR